MLNDARANLLTALVSNTSPSAQSKSLAQTHHQWLIQAGLGAHAVAHLQLKNSALQADSYAATAEFAMRWQNFTRLSRAFHQANLPLIPLKGMALALTVYPQRHQRLMSDIDLWLMEPNMTHAVQIIPQHGFQFQDKDDRPHELQRLSNGEIRFVYPPWPQSLIELHWSPFPGWWLTRTADIPLTPIWQRLIPHTLPNLPAPIHTLAPEDDLIQLSTHLAINHQFSLSGIRTFVDLALLCQKHPLNWADVVTRARTWRVATAVWLTLHTAQQLIPLPGLTDTHMRQLAPSRFKQRLLQTFVHPSMMLNGQDISVTRQRYLLLLLLVDRPRDMLKLIGRTLLPEPEWRHARYGQPTTSWQHLVRLLKSRNV